jgi:O-antigen ligase
MNVIISANAETLKSNISTKKYSLKILLLFLVIISLFSQLWADAFGFTIRLQDILIILLLVYVFFFPALLNLKLIYHRSALNIPLLVWAGVLFFGALISTLHPYSLGLKQNAVVNSFRLIFSISLFFIVGNIRMNIATFTSYLKKWIIGLSIITTIVCILQIGYWDGWLPFSIPPILTTLAEGANSTRGREIFGLFIGDTGSHAWSSMLAMQALIVWLTAQQDKNAISKIILYGYFALLGIVLIRISVRNSILGLAIAIISLILIKSWKSRFMLNRLIKPAFLIAMVTGGIILLFLIAPDTYFIERVRQIIPQWQDGRLIISRQSNIFGRFWYAEMSLRMFAENPIIGKGFYSFRELSPIFSQIVIGDNRVVNNAHNAFLQVLAELGLVGFVIFSWLLFSIFRFLYRTRNYFFLSKNHNFLWQMAVGNFIFLIVTAQFSSRPTLPTTILSSSPQWARIFCLSVSGNLGTALCTICIFFGAMPYRFSSMSALAWELATIREAWRCARRSR